MKNKILCFLTAILSASMLLSSCASTRTDFSIDYTPTGIEEFLNVVCKNIDGDYAKVIDPNYDSPAGNSCYVAEIEVKLPNTVAESVQMRFFNSDYSDKVTYSKVIFYDDDSENAFNCRKAFVVALEKALSGTSYAQDFIGTYYEINSYAYSLEQDEPSIIAEYWLTDDLKVEISCKHSLWNWYLYYEIIKM